MQERVEFARHFNNEFEDENLGDLMVEGNLKEFRYRMMILDSDIIDDFAEELLLQEVIDKAELEA